MDKHFKTQNTNVIFFLDNFGSHRTDIVLTNIKLSFLPVNTTAVTQPLDQGIIKNFKLRYRSKIILKLIAQLDNKESVSDVEIDLKQAINYLFIVWRSVSKTCIKNCFKKAGFEIFPNEQIIEPSDKIEPEIFARWKSLNENNLIPDNVSIDEYVDIDLEIATSCPLTYSSIVEIIVERETKGNDDLDQSETDSNYLCEITNHITTKTVQESFDIIRSYLQSQEKDTEAFQIKLDEIEAFFCKKYQIKKNNNY